VGVQVIMLFRKKFKYYIIIILLVLSLSFTPSVNSASDIFEEPKHVDYDTYKARMIEYANTPDYMKLYMSPVVGNNEYIDSSDIFNAVEDLLDVLPSINDNVDQVTNSPLFKDMNLLIYNKLREYKEIYEVPVDGSKDYLTPYLKDPALASSAIMYHNYNVLAHKIQDIIRDTLLLEDTGVRTELSVLGDLDIMPNGIKFTNREFLERISTAKVLPDGSYKLTDLSPLASKVKPPSTINVEVVGYFLDTNFIVAKPGAVEFIRRNNALQAAGQPILSIKNEPTNFRTTNDGYYPEVLMDKRSVQSDVLLREARDEVIFNGITCDSNGNKIDIYPERVQASSESLGLFVNAEGNVVGEKIVLKNTQSEKIGNAMGFAETGFMFVFAVVSFIVAWVYR
jgi:hypothetical protein